MTEMKEVRTIKSAPERLGTELEIKILYYCKMSKTILEVSQNFGKTYNYIAGILERLFKRGLVVKKKRRNEISYTTPLEVVRKAEEAMRNLGNR